MEETPSYFREKAKQCRRLAAEVVNQDDPIAVALRALAEKFEAKAAAQPADVAKVESRRGVAAASVAAPPLAHAPPLLSAATPISVSRPPQVGASEGA